PDWLRWRKAVAEEHDSLLQHNVWELVDKPGGANVVGCRWILAKNENMEVHCIEIKTGFLHGKLDEDIYMKQPEG
ncbi:unnamed protein product, partial [Heterosigma akashiwo]